MTFWIKIVLRSKYNIHVKNLGNESDNLTNIRLSGSRLDDYRDEGGELRLSLVNPEEPPRDGKPRAIKTDKTRLGSQESELELLI